MLNNILHCGLRTEDSLVDFMVLTNSVCPHTYTEDSLTSTEDNLNHTEDNLTSTDDSLTPTLRTGSHLH